MKTFILKVVTKDIDLTTLVGETIEMAIIDGASLEKIRLGIQGAWEMAPGRSRSFVFVDDGVVQGDAVVRPVPDGSGYAITSSKEGRRTAGLKASPVSGEDAERLRDIVKDEGETT